MFSGFAVRVAYYVLSFGGVNGLRLLLCGFSECVFVLVFWRGLMVFALYVFQDMGPRVFR